MVALGEIDAFGVLRGLCEERLDAASADECAAFDAVLNHLASCRSCDESEVESGCVSLFKLGCRNGFAVCARSEVLELATARFVEAVSMVGSSITVGGLRACSAALLWVQIVYGSYKASADVQAALVPLGTSGLKAVVRAISKAFTAEGACALSLDTLKFGLMDDPELCIACGAAIMSSTVLSGGFITACVSQLDDAGYFAAALTLHKRVMPSPLPVSWWVSTHDVIDATSVYVSGSSALLCGALRKVATYPSGLSDAAHMWLTVAIDMVKMNLEAGLTARAKMSPLFLYQSLGLVEVAARHESQHKMLFDSGVVDALEYTCVNDFVMNGVFTSCICGWCGSSIGVRTRMVRAAKRSVASL